MTELYELEQKKEVDIRCVDKSILLSASNGKSVLSVNRRRGSKIYIF